MRVISLLLVYSYLLFSCKKFDNNSSFEIYTITHHQWHQYKSKVVTIDSNTVTNYDNVSGGISNKKLLVSNWDTVILFNSCIQRSTFNFQLNSTVIINNSCTIQSNQLSVPWTILPGNVMNLSVFSDTVVNNYIADKSKISPVPLIDLIQYGGGEIMEVNDHFIVIKNGIIHSFRNSTGINSDSSDHLVCTQYISFISE